MMKGEKLLMSIKERTRKSILDSVKAGYFTLQEAAERLEISYRQVKRIYSRYREAGDAGLIHRRRGQRPTHAHSDELKGEILTRYKEVYEGFGPTLATEKLEEEGFSLSRETLRLWLIKEGLWQRARKRSPYRKRRERKKQFGELLQLDGSFHAWFGKGHPTACLMNLVDDATGTTLSLLAEQETTEAAMLILRRWIERYGVPKSIYVDLKTVYVSPKTLTIDEQNGLPAAFTHFSRACRKLGIKIIKAYSPQAKGRVERNHAVYQDRFVKELRLKKIVDIKGANKLLGNGFINLLNQKFAKVAADPEDAHRSPVLYGDLNQIFCWEYIRIVQNDWTLRFMNESYQLKKTKPVSIRPRHKLLVRQHLDSSISIWQGEKRLDYEKITKILKPKVVEKKEYSSTLRSEVAKKNKWKTPWSHFNPNWLKKRSDSKVASQAGN
jgi:transposase